MIASTEARRVLLLLATLALASLACGGGGGSGGSAETAVELGKGGPGDAQHHLPLDAGNRWVFRAVSSSYPPDGYVNVVTVEGTREVSGRTATIVRESNGDGWGEEEESAFAPDANGIAYLGNGDAANPFLAALVPYWELRFPLEAGRSFIQLDRKGVSLGEDVDADGRNETLNVYSVVTVAGTDAVTVPVGTFAGCARVEWRMTVEVFLTGSRERFRATGVATAWLAPGVGWVKRSETFSVEGEDYTETTVEELVAYRVGDREERISLRASPETLGFGTGGAAPGMPQTVQVVGVSASGAEVPIAATWTSSNDSVAQVTSYGTPGSVSATVTGLSTGTATVTASVAGIVSNPITVTVQGSSGGWPGPGPMLSRLAVTPASVTVAVGGTASLYTTAFDQNGFPTSSPTVSWASSNPAVATVDSAGGVRGVAPGTASVTASAGGVTSPPVPVTVSSVRSISLPTHDLVYDPARQLVYASIPSTAPGGTGNSVARIDPTTRTVLSYVPVGSEPRKLALSGDGSLLYVALDGAAQVARIDLARSAGPAVDLTFSLGSSAYGPLYAADIAVMPGAPRTVAIALRYASVSPSHAGVVVYDDDVPRPTRTQDHTGSDVIEFSSLGTRLYGFNTGSTESGFRRLAVDASGVSEISVTPLTLGRDITFGGGLVFGTTGLVVDPDAGSGTVRGTFSGLGWGAVVEQSPASDRVLLLTQGEAWYGPWTLKAYDRNTFVPVASETIPGVSGSPGTLVRCGNGGVVFRSAGDYGAPGDKVYFLETAVARP